MTDQAKPPEPKKPAGMPVTEREMDIIFSGAAPFVNKLYVTATGPNARLTFAEQPKGREPVFRAAVTLSLNDLEKLRALIEQVMAGARTVQVEAKSATGESKKDNG